MNDSKLHSRKEKGLDSLIQTVCIFSEDTGMEFGIEKCAMLVMEKRKYILEADKLLEEKMKLNVSKEYIRRLRKVLKSKLNDGNLVCGINTWAVSLLRYSGTFVSWRKSAIDREVVYHIWSITP